MIACGIFMMVLAPFFAKLVRFFPPLVTGTVILIIGLSLCGVAANWVGGGLITEDGAPMKNVALAAGTLLIIVLIERFGRPRFARLSILLGIVIGTLVAIPLGHDALGQGGGANWSASARRSTSAIPTFQIGAIVSMCIVGLVIMTETTGDMLAVGEIVDEHVTSASWPTVCGPTVCPRCSAASSTRSRTPRSRRTSAWCR